MRCALLFLVPAIALSGCGPMTQEEYQQLSNSLSQTNAQMQAYQAQNWNLIQQGQQNMPYTAQPYTQPQQSQSYVVAPSSKPIMTTPDFYKYQNTVGQWVYCNKTSTYTVNCRTQ